MLRLTLDTNAVIHAAQGQPYGAAVDELVDLARGGRVGLCITTAFGNDQARAPADKRQRNLVWLGDRPLIGTVPGGFRLDYSRLGIDTILLSDEQAAKARVLDQLLLPAAYQVGQLQADDPAFMARWRRKGADDVAHLVAHLIAGHDAFVTSDGAMLGKREAIQQRTGIVVVDPEEAVQLVHGQP
jgi:hypothetical protein